MATVPFPSTNPTQGNPCPGCPCSCPVVECSHGPGDGFFPTDSELIVEYLDKRIKNEILPYMHIIKDINLYAFNPEQLAEVLPQVDGEWYCFTQRNRKYPKGSRPNRVAGDGYWKATIADRTVKVNGRTVGFKKALVFFRGKKKTNWIMHEYTSAISSQNRDCRPNQDIMKLDDWVLCRFYERKKGRLQKDNQMDDDCQVNAAAFDDDHMSANSSGGNLNVLAVDENTGNAMAMMPNGQYMYNNVYQNDELGIYRSNIKCSQTINQSDDAADMSTFLENYLDCDNFNDLWAN